jgi:succinate dehydrogenase / fumarate reductase flavoprotein subunit
MQSDVIHNHDVVIIGGGLAGLRAGLAAAEAGADVAIVSKVHPLRSHSVAAQGGINAALGNAPGGEDDTWEKHAFDTVKGSDYLADQDAVEVLCREAAGAVIELEHMGAVFSRLPDGRIAQRPFGGAGFPRTCYAADRTGHNLLHTLYEQCVGRKLRVYEEFFVTSLVIADKRCTGCVALDLSDGTLHGFSAKAVLLATGGYGRIYARSTNAVINTGAGAGLALRVGLPLEDMEFVQFHPTTLYGTNILISEAARGEGGYLLNSRRERFMKRYAEQAMELAPRDIVARAIQTEIDEGRGFKNEYVTLDVTHLGAERINERLPGIRQIAQDFIGADLTREAIPVQPGQHYSMGGVPVEQDGSTLVRGLYAAGECACVSVHGANRLGGNSLLETIVFGRLAGRAMTEAAKAAPVPAWEPLEALLGQELDRIDRLLSRARDERVNNIRDDLHMTMFEMFGIFRAEDRMKEGLGIIAHLKARMERVGIGTRQSSFNQALTAALETEFMLDVAEAVAVSALSRRESRGSHARTDYPKRDDENCLVHTMAWKRSGAIEIVHRPVVLGKFQVEARTY